ncbi:MAG: hypothetical protein J6B54_01865 [Clostridia bacterium]|nr:hypothetical protein [Clostridia bacterium]
MSKNNPSSTLASFATLKSLCDEKKYQSPYQILREFIRYIVITEHLYSFSTAEMNSLLQKHFGFTIPEAVIRSSLKHTEGISLEDKIYSVTMNAIEEDSVFEEKRNEATAYESCIIHQLSEFIFEKTGKRMSDGELIEELALFLTDYSPLQQDYSPLHHTEYTDFIGEFILKNEKDAGIQEGLNRIREGSILYMGLCYNMGETGSIKTPLSLYLGTEILFSLAGYNGQIHQQFANDFFEQVRMANSGGQKKIFLHYFSEIKEEIDDFFDNASDIVEGRKKQLYSKPAMIAITNGCKTSAEVAIKKSDFYHMLKSSFGITEDECKDYYDEIHFSSNLESLEYNTEESCKKAELALKLISHINKLREGVQCRNDIDSRHIIITNAGITLHISKEQSEIIKDESNLDCICGFAISLDRITSLLWYKLGNGFSKKKFPSNVNALLKARVVLSSSIAKNAEKEYTEVKKQYEAGIISMDKVAARIITLRHKPNLPEELKGDDIDESMDFSPEYLSRYEEQYKNTQSALEEKTKLIKSMEEDSARKLAEKEEKIVSQEAVIRGKEDENTILRNKLLEYQRIEEEKNKRRKLIKNILLFVWSIMWKILIIIVGTVIIVALQSKFGWNFTPVLFVVDAAGLAWAILSSIIKAKNKYLTKNEKDNIS